jgi:hypothetical protein
LYSGLSAVVGLWVLEGYIQFWKVVCQALFRVLGVFAVVGCRINSGLALNPFRGLNHALFLIRVVLVGFRLEYFFSQLASGFCWRMTFWEGHQDYGVSNRIAPWNVRHSFEAKPLV